MENMNARRPSFSMKWWESVITQRILGRCHICERYYFGVLWGGLSLQQFLSGSDFAPLFGWNVQNDPSLLHWPGLLIRCCSSECISIFKNRTVPLGQLCCMVWGLCSDCSQMFCWCAWNIKFMVIKWETLLHNLLLHRENWSNLQVVKTQHTVSFSVIMYKILQKKMTQNHISYKTRGSWWVSV